MRSRRGFPCTAVRASAVAAAVLSGCAYYNTFYNARESYEEALELARANPEHPTAVEETLLDNAIFGAGKVISLYPDSRWMDDAQLLIGDASFLLGRRSVTGSGTSHFEDAMMAYSSVLVVSDDPDLRDRASLGMGRAAMELHRFGDAVAALETVSGRDEKRFYVSRILLADALLEDGRHERALTLLDTLPPPSDDSLAAEVLLAGGRSLMAAGLPDSAAVRCLAAAEVFGRGRGYYNALVSAALAYIESGRPDAAGEVLDRLLLGYRSDLEMARIALLNGRAKEQGGDRQAALAAYASAAELDRSREFGAEALYRKALLEEEMGRVEDALGDLSAAAGRSSTYLWSRLASDRLVDLELLQDYTTGLARAGPGEAARYGLLVAEKRRDLYGTADEEADSILRELSFGEGAGDVVTRARALVLLADRPGVDPGEERELLLEALELSREGDLATRLEKRLGIAPAEGMLELRPSGTLERGWEMIESGRYEEAWALLSETLESPWSDEVRPALLWAAATAAEFARLDDSIVEGYMEELSREYPGTDEGTWATDRLGDYAPEEGGEGDGGEDDE